MEVREKRIFTGMEADRNETAAECSLYQGAGTALKKLFLPLVLCNRDFPEKYCNITVILYNRVLGAKDG